MNIANAILNGKLEEAKSAIRNELYSRAKFVIEQSREDIMNECVESQEKEPSDMSVA